MDSQLLNIQQDASPMFSLWAKQLFLYRGVYKFKNNKNYIFSGFFELLILNLKSKFERIKIKDGGLLTFEISGFLNCYYMKNNRVSKN